MNEEILNEENLKRRLIGLVSLSTEYCHLCENASEFNKEEFIDQALDLLPRIYWEFFDLSAPFILDDFDYFSSYVDEDYYDGIRRNIERVMGEDDVYLETFEEDMKYSETPIGASIAESLADIFQPLYNFVAIVKDSDGEQMNSAFANCKEDFAGYWSQTLCNVLRALNHIKYSN